MTPYDAVVLAGGTARRMGGRDKTRLTVGGSTLLDRVLAASASAAVTVVVGDPRPTCRPVRWVREDPPGSGPAAAIAAALPGVTAPVAAVLAADVPFLSADGVRRLLEAVGSTGAVAVDGEGREQWLIGAWPTAVLRDTALRENGSLRAALAPLHPALIRLGGEAAFDCDTPRDLQRARRMAGVVTTEESA